MKSYPQPESKNGLPEPVLQKIRAVFARYPQVEKAVFVRFTRQGHIQKWFRY